MQHCFLGTAFNGRPTILRRNHGDGNQGRCDPASRREQSNWKISVGLRGFTVATRAQQSISRSRLVIFLCVTAAPLMMQGSLDLGLHQLAL